MKKNILLLLLAAVAVMFSGCAKEEVQPYKLNEESINFYVTGAGVSNNRYPSILEDEIVMVQIGKYSGGIYQPVQEFSFRIELQTQGRIRETERTVRLLTEIDGYQFVPEWQEYTFEPGQSAMSITFNISNLYIPRGKYSACKITFDYGNSDFIGGTTTQQTRTIIFDNIYTLERVGLSPSMWNSYYAGRVGGTAGYGPWSNTKGAFIADILGLANYYQDLGDPTYIYADFVAHRNTLRAALEEYKANWRLDPDTYPPLLDDGKNDGSWIAFEEE